MYAETLSVFAAHCMRNTHVIQGTTMNPPNVLHHGEWTALHDHAGRRVVCLSGSVWITQDRDRRDVVLSPGQGFTLDRPGMAVVSALADASFAVYDALVPRGAPPLAAQPLPCSR